MPHRRPITAVFPGSFDPVTNGHLDIIRRAARLFNRLIVGIGLNPGKAPMFSQAERRALIEPHIAGLKNVSVRVYTGLTIDFVKQCGGDVLLRGIRDLGDLSDELQQASVNQLVGGIETVFLPTSDQYVLTSSTYIKQIYEMGGSDPRRVRQLVPQNVAEALREKLAPVRRGAPARPRASAPRK
ncbi:MAG: pantetheine-phosphate adenylyltransferase [Planctomycetia bacterium]|nr:MAG: pantetheine-phosphate adenylyltransferase [Planctomycetia bacterium]